jgi:hypothetical protein
MRRIKRSLVSLALALPIIIAVTWFVYRPWALTWGATAEEVNRSMPGDCIAGDSYFKATRAVTIRASPNEIWPWLVQMGYGKAGFYSYDWLDNDGIPSAERILPEYQNLEVGDLMPLSAHSRMEAKVLKPAETLLLVGVKNTWTWTWGLYREDSEHTRLVARLHADPKGIFSRIMVDLFEIVMMRKCLLGIKRRAEALARSD